MNRTTYRKTAVNLLRGIVAQRRWLLKHNKGYVEPEFCMKEIANIEAAIPRLVDPDQVRNYLRRKHAELCYLIPASNRKRHQELERLITENIEKNS